MATELALMNMFRAQCREVKMHYSCESFLNLDKIKKQQYVHPVIPSNFTQPHTSQLQYRY